MSAKSSAHTLLVNADKRAASSTGWLSSASSKYEEAGDLSQQAANVLKIDKLFKEAGDAHAREPECEEKSQESKAYERGNPDLTIQALSLTITYLTQQGRFRQAVDRETEIGHIYLQEVSHLRKACESFEHAATAEACRKDATGLHADLQEYPQAITRYEQVANGLLSSATDDSTLVPPISNANLENKGARVVLTAKRVKELEREAKEKEYADGQHANYIDGVWHCSNCGCPESIAIGRRKGPLGDKSQCGACGKFWHRHRRPRPVPYNSALEHHQNLKDQEQAKVAASRKKRLQNTQVDALSVYPRTWRVIAKL